MSLPRPTSCAYAPLCAGSSSSRRRKGSHRIATLAKAKGLPAAAHNAAGCQPTTDVREKRTMSAVLDRFELEQSPLADLHLLANELGVDGFRRLRKPELVDAIIARQAGEPEPVEPTAEE